MRKKIGWSAVAALLATSYAAAAEDSALLIQWLQGDFTNYQQTLAEPEHAITPVLHRVTELDIEYADGTPLLVEQFSLFDQSEALRTQVYVIEQTRQGVRQHVYEVAGDPAYRDNWQALYGCRIDWRWQEDSWLGQRDPARCYFYDQNSQAKIGLGAELRLSDMQFSVRDMVQYPDNVPFIMSGLEGYYMYERMQYASVDVEYKAAGTSQWVQAEPLTIIHDQGIRAGFRLADSELELRYQIELSRADGEHQVQLFHMHETAPVEEVQGYLADGLLIETDSIRVRLVEAEQ